MTLLHSPLRRTGSHRCWGLVAADQQKELGWVVNWWLVCCLWAAGMAARNYCSSLYSLITISFKATWPKLHRVLCDVAVATLAGKVAV